MLYLYGDLNPKFNSEPNPKPFFYFILILSNFDYGQFQLNNKRSYPGWQLNYGLTMNKTSIPLT